MSSNIMRAAIAAHAAAGPPDPYPYYPVKLDHSPGHVRKAAEKLVAESPLPRWFPDIKWEIVEVHRYPDPDRLVGHSGHKAGEHALAFVIVRDAAAGDHWLHFRVVESKTPFVEVVHSREHHMSLEGHGPLSPSRRQDWITHCTPRSAEELGGWLDALEQVAVVLEESGPARLRQQQQYHARMMRHPIVRKA